MSDKRSAKGLSDREAALIAAARRELGKAPPESAHAPAAISHSSTASRPAPATQGTAPAILKRKADTAAARILQNAATPETPVAAPKPDAATRMAMLLESERLAAEERKRRIRRNYMAVLATIMVVALIYFVVNLFRLLTS
jgi:hypothetical protein